MSIDFIAHSQLAQRNSALLSHIEEDAKTRKVCAPSLLAHPAALEVEAATHALFERAQAAYRGDRQSLRFTIAVGPKTVANAFAYWLGAHGDWVVLTSGLIDLLWTESLKLDRLTLLVQDELIGNFACGKSLRSTPSRTTEGGSAFRELLFSTGLAFFIGHELGHLLDGHSSSYIRGNTKAKAFNGSDENARLRKQALELRADRFGVEYAMRFALIRLSNGIYVHEPTKAEQAHLQAQAAYVATLGMCLAAAMLRPKPVDFRKYLGADHPPSAVRALWLSSEAISRMSEWLPLIDEDTMRHISISALAQVNAMALLPYDRVLDRFESEVSKERVLLAMRETGIRKLIFDDAELPSYVETMKVMDAELHPILQAHQRKLRR
ncbi:M56 family metallopeptidase [Burkholderia gladioli]|uniref:M48 family metalloprotease n=1 Tax=Burkholderia gladioli TaxID=28095 RepID=UPI0028633176|nr:M48 family metalloprotease [Burkholderia gladioli]MDR8093254.1 M56 family metallopeptidase [Burkholderia gladioli]